MQTLKWVTLLAIIYLSWAVAWEVKNYIRENPSPLAKRINEVMELIRKERGQ